MNEADSFLRLRSKTSRQHWRAAAVESISPVALGGSEEVTEGLRPCTLSSLDTSAPFSFLAPCCYMYPRLRQEGTVRKKSQVLFVLKGPPALHLEAGTVCNYLWAACLMPFQIL